MKEKNILTFKDDKLNRYDFAENVSKIIDREKEGYVLGIDAEWGGGKTWFVNMFKNALKNGHKDIVGGHECLYFDAWENDFSKEPLLNFIGELLEEIKPKQKSKKKVKEIKGKIKNYVNTIIKSGIPIVSKIAISCLMNKVGFEKKYIKNMTDFSDKALNLTLNKASNEHKDVKDAIKNLKIILQEFITEGKSLVIFVDELDRCRPDYAIELLECIKHIFRTDNVFFILSINRNELCNSIKSVYGNINAKQYLKRFIDYTVKLPEPKHKDFIEVLLKSFSEEDNFLSTYQNLKKETNDIFAAISDMCNFTLRDIEQTFEEFKIIYGSFDDGLEKVFSGYLICFLVLKNQSIYDYDVFKEGCEVSSLEKKIGYINIGNLGLNGNKNKIIKARDKINTFNKSLYKDPIFSKKILNFKIVGGNSPYFFRDKKELTKEYKNNNTVSHTFLNYLTDIGINTKYLKKFLQKVQQFKEPTLLSFISHKVNLLKSVDTDISDED